MTTPAHVPNENVRKVCDPGTILGQIENSVSGPGVKVGDPNASRARAPRLRVIHGDEEIFDEQLDQPLEVPQQILELTTHLKRRRDELESRERDLKEQLASWQVSIDQRNAANSEKERELTGRERQLRSLQFHLLQMQNDIIDSQLSMEKVIEHFENSDSDEYMKLALEMLRFEVLDRFDYVSQRWDLLHGKLENLYVDKPLKNCA